MIEKRKGWKEFFKPTGRLILVMVLLLLLILFLMMTSGGAHFSFWDFLFATIFSMVLFANPAILPYTVLVLVGLYVVLCLIRWYFFVEKKRRNFYTSFKKDLKKYKNRVLLVVLLLVIIFIGYKLIKIPEEFESGFFDIKYQAKFGGESGEQDFVDVKIRFPFDFYGYSEVNRHFKCIEHMPGYGKTCPVLSYSETNSFNISQVATIMSRGRVTRVGISFKPIKEGIEQRIAPALEEAKDFHFGRVYSCLRDSLDGWAIILIRKEATKDDLPTGITYLLYGNDIEAYEIREVGDELLFNWFEDKLVNGNFSECEAVIIN